MDRNHRCQAQEYAHTDPAHPCSSHPPTCGCQCISFRSFCPPCTNSSWGGRLSGARALVSGASAASSSAGAAAGAAEQGRRRVSQPAGECMPPLQNTKTHKTAATVTCSTHSSGGGGGGSCSSSKRTWVLLQRQVPHRQLVVGGGGGQHGTLVGAPLNRGDRAPAGGQT